MVELRARARGAMPTFGPSAAAAAATEVRLPGVSVLALTRAWTLSAPWAWACLALIRRIQLNSQRQGAGDPGGGAGGLWSCSEQTETSETMQKPFNVSVGSKVWTQPLQAQLRVGLSSGPVLLRVNLSSGHTNSE